MVISAAPEPGLSHVDGRTAGGAGDAGVNTGIVICFNSTLCLRASLMGNRFMLICYSMHRKSHLMLHCKINLISAGGCFIFKGGCLVCPTCVRSLHAVSVSAFIGS